MLGRESIILENKKVNLSLFSYLFAELISYLNSKDDKKSLEERLSEIGFPIGQRMLEYCALGRQARFAKPEKILPFIKGKVWTLLFGKEADSLEQSEEVKNEYRIHDHEPIVNRYLANKDEQINCGAFVAGIIEGLLNSANYPAKVTAKVVEADIDEERKRIVVYFILFDPKCLL
jgi:hypothetical protein